MALSTQNRACAYNVTELTTTINAVTAKYKNCKNTGTGDYLHWRLWR